MKNSILSFLVLWACLVSVKSAAQQGKDGSLVTATNTVVNLYTPLAANAVAGNTSIAVSSTVGIAPGDLVFIIQMQGVAINCYHDTTGLLDGTNSYIIDNSIPYGKVMNLYACGNNEYAQVNSISGSSLNLDCGLKYSYDKSGHTQVLRVPRYSSVTINSGGNVTCQQWNGSTGGVVAIEVQGNTVINTGGKIDASGLGFRGAAVHNHGSGSGASNYGTTHWDYAAWKGEGVAGDTSYYRSKYAGPYGWGAMANGGGGGEDNNAGGGGGSNAGYSSTYPWTGKGVPDGSVAGWVTAWNLESAGLATSHSSGGGRGGYTYSSQNASTYTTAPGNASWGGDTRRVLGGMGGEPLDYSTGKIFMGGGGGAGDESENQGGPGGNGGGIVYLLSYGTVTGGGQILSNGANGTDSYSPAPTVGNCSGKEGGGGGGAGGAILINSVGTISLTNTTPISATGGKGGNVVMKCSFSTNHDGYGPGGGGGGGYLGTSNTVGNTTASGGVNGTVSGSGTNYSSNIATNFPPNGATKGDSGVKASLATFYITANNYTVCAGTSASLSVTANGTGIPSSLSYNWYNTQTGGTAVFTGNPYNTGSLSVGTYTYYAGTCPGTYRIPVVVTVLTAPTVSVAATPTAVCPGQTATLTAIGASTYTWSANAGSVQTATAVVTPTVSSTYTVTGANGTCTNTQTVAVGITTAQTLTVTATPTAVCPGQTATLTAIGASTYTWSANAGSVQTATAVVTPTVSTTYTVTGANGTCTNTQTVTVGITTAPTITATASSASVCPGQSFTLTANGAASYTWSANAGGVQTATAVATQTATSTYTVTGANGTCTNTQTVTVGITTAPTITATASSASVCPGQSFTLTANGAASYTWSANAGGVQTATAVTTQTTTTTYTVTGDNGGCTSMQTVTVGMSTAPTLTVTATPTAVCSGSSSTLTAIGAGSYTWSANAGSVQTASAVVTPTANATYTVYADNGGCTTTQTVSVIMKTPPTLTITASSNPICSGTSITLTASGALNYTWSSNAGGGNTSTVSVTPTTTTSYTLTGDSSGCVSTAVTSIVVNSGPTAADSSLVSANCNQSNGSYSLNSVTGGTAGYQINFNNAGFTGISSFPYIVSNLQAGPYPITIKDNNGCTYTTSINIANVGGITQVDTTVGGAICNPPNSGYIAINSITGGTGPYQDSLNGGSFATIASFPDTLKNLVAGNYTLTVKDNAGCRYTSFITVSSIGGITQVNTSTQPAACVPDTSGMIVIASVTGGTGPFQYSLNSGTLTNIASFPDSIKHLQANTYVLTIQDAAGCSSTSTVTVANPNAPTAASSTTGNDTCAHNVGTLNVTSVTGGTTPYQYSLNGGSFQSSASFTGLPSMIDTVTVKDANGCVFTFQDTVGLFTIPTPTVTPLGPVKMCPGGNVILTSSSANGNLWNNNATTQSVIITSTAPGSYWVTISQYSCTVSSNTVQVGVYPTPNVSVASATICAGDSTTLSAIVTPSGTASSYTWSPAATLSSASTATVTASPTVTTSYSITVQDTNACYGYATATVVVGQVPSALPPQTFQYCLYASASSLSVTPSPGDSVHWYDSNLTPLPTAPTPSTNIMTPVTYYVSQTSSPGNCESPKTLITVIVNTPPSAEFATAPTGTSVFTSQTVTFTPTQVSANNAYYWNFNEPSSGSANTSTQAVATHSFSAEGLYCPHLLVVSLQTGCSDSNTVCLDAFNGITVTIPNVFTPNQDGINEVFSIKTDGINELICEIYDRWGLKMYSWNSPTGFWDGTTNGKQCSDGTYFYVVSTKDFKGISKTYKGYVQLIR